MESLHISNTEYDKALLSDIFQGNLATYSQFKKCYQKEVDIELPSFGSYDYGFQWLLNQSDAWLKSKEGIIDDIWKEHFPKGNSEIILKIKELIVFRKQGVSQSVLMSSLQDKHLSEIEELDLTLLVIGLTEPQKNEFESVKLDFIKSWSERISVSNKPHLSPVLVFLNREYNPRKAIDSVIVGLACIDLLDPLPFAIQNYLIDYLRQSIYNFLDKAHPYELINFKHHIKKRLETASDWIKELWEEVWESKTLNDLVKKLENQKEELSIIKANQIFNELDNLTS